jgi:hypothetical protein
MDVAGYDLAGAREIRVGVGRLARWLAGFDERHGPVTVTTEPEIVGLTGADGAQAWLDVPFPPLDGDLVEHAERSRRIAVLLVRRGGYAVGTFEGERLVASKVGSSYVQGTTKAGGWSQQRYARRRANQADAAFAEAAEVAVRLLVPKSHDALVAGGDRAAVRTVLADPRLSALPPVSPPWLQVKDPKLRILAATPEQFRAVRIRLVP